MSFPLPASIEFSSSDEDEAVSAKAPVCIVVHEAKCLPTVQWIGRQDPYAIATSRFVASVQLVPAVHAPHEVRAIR